MADRNLIAVISDENPRRRDVHQIEKIVIHRTSVGLGAADIAEFHKDNPQWVGPHMPYTFVITKSGSVEQALPLTTISSHALAWNTAGLSIGVVGDFTQEHATKAQIDSLLWLSRQTMGYLILKPTDIVGHMELDSPKRRASRDPRKECPGKYLDVDKIRQLVRDAVSDECAYELAELGGFDLGAK